jgi:SAM-dependent methyltransferase
MQKTSFLEEGKHKFSCVEYWKDRWARRPRQPGTKEDTRDCMKEGLSFLLRTRKIPLEGKSLLDIGCGSGEMLDWFKRRFGMIVEGVEVGKSAIEKVQERGIFIYQGDLREVKLYKHFDFMFSSFVSQHMISDEDITKFYNIPKKYLKYKGMFILVDHLKEGIFKENKKFRGIEEHRKLWKKIGLKEVLIEKLHPERDDSWKFIVLLKRMSKPRKIVFHQ